LVQLASVELTGVKVAALRAVGGGTSQSA